jgi:hypothetical protein
MSDAPASASELRRIRSTGDIAHAQRWNPPESWRPVVEGARRTRMHVPSRSVGGPPLPQSRPMGQSSTTVVGTADPSTAAPSQPQPPQPIITVDAHIRPTWPTSAPPSSVNTMPDPHPPLRRQHNRSHYTRIMAFFGYGRTASRARRMIVSLLWNLSWGFVQVCTRNTVQGTKPQLTPQLRSLSSLR